MQYNKTTNKISIHWSCWMMRPANTAKMTISKCDAANRKPATTHNMTDNYCKQICICKKSLKPIPLPYSGNRFDKAGKHQTTAIIYSMRNMIYTIHSNEVTKQGYRFYSHPSVCPCVCVRSEKTDSRVSHANAWKLCMSALNGIPNPRKPHTNVHSELTCGF